MPPIRWTDLIDHEPAAAVTLKDLRIVRQSRKVLSKEQDSFNRLVLDASRLQNRLLAWQGFAEKQRQQMRLVLMPLMETVRQARHHLIRTCADVLEPTHGGHVPTKTERRLLIAFLLEICEAYLGDPGGDHPEVVAIFDVYSPTPHAERQPPRIHRERTRRTSSSDLPAGGAPAQPRPSVREVFRKLASALHPDRAANEDDRNRRNGLMQRVNLAYEAVDLLALLQLQFEIRQLDAGHMATIPETRLREYNEVLRDRVAQLEREVKLIADQFRMAVGGGVRSITPETVEREFEKQLEALRADAAEMKEWADALPLSAWRKAWLKDREQALQENERRLKNADALGLRDPERVGRMSGGVELRSSVRKRGSKNKHQR